MVSKYFIAGLRYELTKQAMTKQALIPETLIGLGGIGLLGDAFLNKGQGLGSLIKSIKGGIGNFQPSVPKPTGPSVLDYEKGMAGFMGDGLQDTLQSLKPSTYMSPTGQAIQGVGNTAATVPLVTGMAGGVSNFMKKHIPGVASLGKYFPRAASALGAAGKVLSPLAKVVSPIAGANLALHPGNLETYGKFTGLNPDSTALKLGLGTVGGLAGLTPVGRVGAPVASIISDLADRYSNTKAENMVESGNQLGRSYEILNKMQRDNSLDPNALKAWLELNPNYKENYKFSPAILNSINRLRANAKL